MLSSPVFLQSIEDRLRAVRNDYSECEALFQAGADLPLVDTRSTDEMNAEDLMRIARTREAYVREILYAGARVLGVSIVIPIHGGASLLAECLISISRQTFVQQRPSEVDVIVVEDGVPEGEGSVFSSSQVNAAASALVDSGVCVILLRLPANYGRAQARNCGLSRVTRPLVLFVDGSMILEPSFVADHVWRHTRLQSNVALLGFKQNIDWASFLDTRPLIVSGPKRPDFTKDLKWAHVLTADEGGFDYKDQYFKAGDTISYMKATENFKALTGVEQIGLRTLPSFFQTNIVSVQTQSVKGVGGFVPQMQGWGLEDTLLGALLVARGCKLIPCPTSVAFNVEYPSEPRAEKKIDLKVSRAKYNDFISKTRIDEYSVEKFDETVRVFHDKVHVVSTTLPRSAIAKARQQRRRPGGAGVAKTEGRPHDWSPEKSDGVREQVAECLARYRSSYAHGHITEAFHHISEAYRLNANDTGVLYRYAVVLMRLGRYQAVNRIVAGARIKGIYDDAVKGVEAEYLRRSGEPEHALDVLENVADSAYYNVAYEKGMCKLLIYSRRQRISDLLQAVGHLREARQVYPQHWWVTTNLAIAIRVLGQRDSALDKLVIDQLEAAIKKHPLKASARIYRLLYYVMIQDADHLTATIASDHKSCPSTMEIACDFFDTVQERVGLMCPNPVVAQRLMEELKQWPLPFTLLHA